MEKDDPAAQTRVSGFFYLLVKKQEGNGLMHLAGVPLSVAGGHLYGWSKIWDEQGILQRVGGHILAR